MAVLFGAAASAGFLFDVEKVTSRSHQGSEDGQGLQSVYATAISGAVGCRPDADAFSEPGGSESVESIADDVEKLRGLRFESEPEVEFMTPDELEAHVTEASREELDEETAEVEVQALQQIGVIPEGFDVDDFIEGSAEQVLGLYDPIEKELLVADSGEFDPRAQLTIAHELDHAVTDEILGFPDLRFVPGKADEQLAQRALIEGDATLLMQHYGLVEFPDELQEILAGSATPEQQESYRELPHYLQRAFAFPYQEGSLFACELYGRNGWDTIDDAYSSLPSSTLEILFPDLYGKVEPEEPDAPNDPDTDWNFIETAALGAVDLQWMFEAPGGELTGTFPEAARQVSRWRGGRLHIWQRGEDLIVAMSIVEGRDLTGSDASSICDRLIRWYADSDPEATFSLDKNVKGAWSGDGVGTVIDCEGDQTRFVSAPDLRTALRVGRFG